MATHITGPGLRSAASLAPATDAVAADRLSDEQLARSFEQDLAKQALDKIEVALGGRGSLASELVSSPDITEGIRYILTLIFDPRYDQYSLGALCRMAGILPGEFFRAFRDAKLAKQSLVAMNTMATASWIARLRKLRLTPVVLPPHGTRPRESRPPTSKAASWGSWCDSPTRRGSRR